MQTGIKAGKTLSLDIVNYINIGLMVVSGGLALVFPFYLFLFSYAVLGPLHYLTEISWLHDRRYFLKNRLHVLPLVLATIGITLLAFLAPGEMHGRMIGLILMVSLALAGLMISLDPVDDRYWLIGVLAIFAVLFWSQPAILLLAAIFVPTLIHVFVFTGAFIFAGHLKSKRISGIVSILVFVGVATLLLLWHPAVLDAGYVSDYEQRTFGRMGESSSSFGFVGLNYFILKLFGVGIAPFSSSLQDVPAQVNDFLYRNPQARALMAFIAYAYTYHYLNWFSKTSIIGWHRASSKRLYAMLAIWFTSLGLYATDYQLGLRWLFFLSLLHVVLELPLNYITFIAIGKSIMPRRIFRQAA
jgi:hypothetical protein